MTYTYNDRYNKSIFEIFSIYKLFFNRTLSKECEEAENIRAVCEFSQGLRSAVEVDLLPLYHLGEARYRILDRPYPIASIPIVPDGILRTMKRMIETYGLKCDIVI